jgi:L-serine dehydratase
MSVPVVHRKYEENLNFFNGTKFVLVYESGDPEEKMTKKILVPVADGIEMIEALSIVDVFRRAGAQVDLASVNDLVITSSHNVRISADKLIQDCIGEDYDLVALPGGIPGAENLRNSETLISLLKKQDAAGKFFGAICASPAVVLAHHGLLEGKKATGHPFFTADLHNRDDSGAKVVVDRNCITSRGAGTAVDFSLELLGLLMGEEKKKEVARGMVVDLEKGACTINKSPQSLPSIFNNVVGPIMRGPSSSHTAASVRIGLLGRRLLQEDPVEAVVTFDPEGSLATTYRGQGSAMGLAAGLLGMRIDDPDLVKAEQICLTQGIRLVFRVEKYGAVHPNTYRIELKGKNGRKVRFVALSTGGGIIRLTELDGQLVQDDQHYLDGLFPITADKNSTPSFTSLDQLEQLLAVEGGKLSEHAEAYESALGNVDGNYIIELARQHLRVMKSSVTTGIKGTSWDDRILPRQSHLLAEAERQGKVIPAVLTNAVITAVTAVMETKSSMGVIAAAPTAGSCGTLAGALTAVAAICGKPEEEMVRGLLAAGLIGVFVAQQGGFAAEEGGCQYECGVASGMTAAALVELMGGDGKSALNAASMAMQNTLGLICDPVADRVEVPCLGKNIMAALNGIAAANMILAGFEHVIPLAQVIIAMKEVGQGMDHRFRCTCKGGLSITPEARKIQRCLAEKQGAAL